MDAGAGYKSVRNIKKIIMKFAYILRSLILWNIALFSVSFDDMYIQILASIWFYLAGMALYDIIREFKL